MQTSFLFERPTDQYRGPQNVIIVIVIMNNIFNIIFPILFILMALTVNFNRVVSQLAVMVKEKACLPALEEDPEFWNLPNNNNLFHNKSEHTIKKRKNASCSSFTSH